MGARQRFDDEPAGCVDASPAPELRADDYGADDCGGGGNGGGDAWTWRSARTRFFLLFIITLRVGVDGMLLMTLSYVFRDEPFACSAGSGTSGALASPSSSSCAACAGAPAPVFSAYSASVSAAAMYGLVCSRLWVVAAIKSAFFLGMGLGGSVGGYAAERFGRRRSCSSFTPMVSWPAAAFFALGSGPVSLGVGYAVSGFSIGFHLVPLYLMVVEVFHDVPSWRARCGSTMWVGWCVMVASVAGIALAIDARAARIAAAAGPAMPAWRLLLLTVFALQLPVVAVLARYLPESPAWLRANGMHAELREVMGFLRGERGAQRRPASPRSGACAGAKDAGASSQGDLQRLLAPIDEAAELTDEPGRSDDGAAASLAHAVRQRPGADLDGEGEGDGDGDADADAPPARGAEGRPASLLSMRDRHLGRPMLMLTLNTLVSWFSVSLVRGPPSTRDHPPGRRRTAHHWLTRARRRCTTGSSSTRRASRTRCTWARPSARWSRCSRTGTRRA